MVWSCITLFEYEERMTIHNEHTVIIGENFDQAVKKCGSEKLGACMLEKFFQRYPEAQALFTGINIADFSSSKFRIISEHIVDCVKRPEHATYNMFCEIHRHSYLEINDVEYHYALIETCREAVEEALADQWTTEINEHWNDVVQASKAVIQQAWIEASDK